jgi:hypothetical protein
MTDGKKTTPEQLEQNRQQMVMKATKAYEDLLAQLVGHPVDVVIIWTPKITKKRVSPAIATYTPGGKVYAMLLDTIKKMTESMQNETSDIEDVKGKRIRYEPKITH